MLVCEENYLCQKIKFEKSKNNVRSQKIFDLLKNSQLLTIMQRNVCRTCDDCTVSRYRCPVHANATGCMDHMYEDDTDMMCLCEGIRGMVAGCDACAVGTTPCPSHPNAYACDAHAGECQCRVVGSAVFCDECLASAVSCVEHPTVYVCKAHDNNQRCSCEGE